MSHPRGSELVVRQEHDRLDWRTAALVSLASAVVAAVSIGVVAWMIGARSQGRSEVAGLASAASPSSTVETSLILATERGVTLRAEQRAALARYEWVDRAAGIAKIPIDRAIDLTAGGAP